MQHTRPHRVRLIRAGLINPVMAPTRLVRQPDGSYVVDPVLNRKEA